MHRYNDKSSSINERPPSTPQNTKQSTRRTTQSNSKTIILNLRSAAAATPPFSSFLTVIGKKQQHPISSPLRNTWSHMTRNNYNNVSRTDMNEWTTGLPQQSLTAFLLLLSQSASPLESTQPNHHHNNIRHTNSVYKVWMKQTLQLRRCVILSTVIGWCTPKLHSVAANHTI